MNIMDIIFLDFWFLTILIRVECSEPGDSVTSESGSVIVSRQLSSDHRNINNTEAGLGRGHFQLSSFSRPSGLGTKVKT